HDDWIALSRSHYTGGPCPGRRCLYEQATTGEEGGDRESPRRASDRRRFGSYPFERCGQHGPRPCGWRRCWYGTMLPLGHESGLLLLSGGTAGNVPRATLRGVFHVGLMRDRQPCALWGCG